MIDTNLIKTLMLFRICGVFFIQTTFVPDETWQSVEVAHKFIFGYGYLTWEWQPETALRSFIHAGMFASIFNILKFLQLDYRFLVVYLPHVLQAVLTAFSDFCFYEVCNKNLSSRGARKSAFVLYVFNWFVAYCASRTLINTLECNLFIIALFFFDYQTNVTDMSDLKVLFPLIAASTAIRPPSLIPYIPILCFIVYRAYENRMLKQVIYEAFKTACIAILLIILIDSIYYRQWVFTPWNFIQFNVLSGKSALFGSHPIHWYLTNGLPVIFGPSLPFLIIGLIKPFVDRSQLKDLILPITVVWTILAYSLIAHKEFRFIMPLIPAMSLLFPYDLFSQIPAKMIKFMVQFFIAFNMIMLFYFGVVHQRAPNAVMSHLYNKCSSAARARNACNIMFLTPCHATPFYSHLHLNVTMEFLTCDVFARERGEKQVADEFFENPLAWIGRNLNEKNLPSHLVFFNDMLPVLQSYLQNKAYRNCDMFFHAHFTQERQSDHMVVCERTVKKKSAVKHLYIE